MAKFVTVLAILMSLGAILAFPSFKPGVRIINGESAEPGQFPFAVALLNNAGQFCDGSIINKNWIVTAAHCVEGIPIESVQVVAGTNLIHTGGIFYNVTNAVYHPDYNNVTVKNDIGLIKIDGKFEFNDLLQPIDLGNAETNDTVTVLGWGQAEDIPFPEDLRYLELRALSLEECAERAEGHAGDFYLGPEQVCALSSDDNKGVCFGDSGGPLVSNGKLVGIVSYTLSACANGAPDVYTRPSVYSDWISQITQE